MIHFSYKYMHSLVIKLTDCICAYSQAADSANLTAPTYYPQGSFSIRFLAFTIYTLIFSLTVKATLLSSSTGFLLSSILFALEFSQCGLLFQWKNLFLIFKIAILSSKIQGNAFFAFFSVKARSHCQLQRVWAAGRMCANTGSWT